MNQFVDIVICIRDAFDLKEPHGREFNKYLACLVRDCNVRSMIVNPENDFSDVYICNLEKYYSLSNDYLIDLNQHAKTRIIEKENKSN